eukprot:RCo034104
MKMIEAFCESVLKVCMYALSQDPWMSFLPLYPMPFLPPWLGVGLPSLLCVAVGGDVLTVKSAAGLPGFCPSFAVAYSVHPFPPHRSPNNPVTSFPFSFCFGCGHGVTGHRSISFCSPTPLPHSFSLRWTSDFLVV